MQQGYIKLYRCVLDNSWSRQPDFMAVWVYCLLRGSYKASDVVTKGGSIVHLDPGQFITSREQISIQTGVQESKVERILKVFKSEQQIEQISKGKYRIISIVNWQKYQAREQDDEQQTNNKRTTDEQQLNTDKKVKKEKEKPKAFDLPSWVPREAWDGWLEARRKKRVPTTDRALQLALKKLSSLVGEGHDAEEVLDQSTAKGWTDLYEVKTKVPASKPPPRKNNNEEAAAFIEKLKQEGLYEDYER